MFRKKFIERDDPHLHMHMNMDINNCVWCYGDVIR